MSLRLARLDLTQIFCDVDDFYHEFERYCERAIPRLLCDGQPKGYQSRLSISEVMTIAIAFHGSGYRTFADYFQNSVACGVDFASALAVNAVTSNAHSGCNLSGLSRCCSRQSPRVVPKQFAWGCAQYHFCRVAVAQNDKTTLGQDDITYRTLEPSF